MVMQCKESTGIKSETQSFFKSDSPLKKADSFGGRPYEYRHGQADMASGVAEALEDNHNLCVEAPTGIGKSFAYLVPSIHYAINESKKVLITTETINLQEQLIDKDIPLLQKLMGVDFKAVLAKGRSNYLCKRRLFLTTGENRSEYLPLNSMQPEAQRVVEWADETKDGSRSTLDFSLDPQVWGLVCCEAGNCTGPKCSHFRGCFYWQARKEWEKADLIVANHALFFTDLKLKSGEELDNTLLPLYDAVVIDEAHTLEDNAADHLGLRLTDSAISYFLNRLFNSTSGKGLLTRAGEESMELRKIVKDIQDTTSTFFNMIEEVVSEKDDSFYRVRKPGIVPDLLSEKLSILKKNLQKYKIAQEDDDFRTELDAQLLRCDGYAQGIYDFINMKLEDHVYWIENRENAERDQCTLYSAPLNVNILLQSILFNKKMPVILTSATLSVKNNLEYYKQRVGFINGEEMILESPFNHAQQVEVYIPKRMPEPNNDEYFDIAIEEIERFVDYTHGKAFVLFTSYQMLRKASEEMEDYFLDKDITLLAQGGDMTRSSMLREFKEDINSVIFGTTSFWTGVDVPGEALSNVIITKIPFAVPTHPLIKARSERIESSGKNAFMEYSLPEAVLKFRQGIGRLIRSKQDRGVIAILDKRVISKRYGQFFLDSIPTCPINVF